MVAGKSQPPGLGGAKMDKFKEQDRFLYYKNDLVATFIPEISFVVDLHKRITDSYTYK